MKRNKPILILSSLLLAVSVGAQTFIGADVGTPGLPGSVTGTAPGVQTITGGGNDIWGTYDNFYYVYTSVTGQVWDAKMRVQDLQGPDNWTKVELMARVPDASGIPQGPDPFVAAMTTRAGGQNEIGPQYRATSGGEAGNANFGFTGGTIRPTYPNTWLRLTRQYNMITMWYGTNGTTWNKYADIDTAQTLNGFGTPFPDPLLVGVAVTAHNDGDLTGGVATVSDLTITVILTPPNLTAVTQVQDASTYVGSDAYFSFAVTNSTIANGTVANYQWYKNDQLITNANSRLFAVFASATDNGAKVYCTASLPGALVYSATGTVTVATSTEYPGFLKYQVYPGRQRADVNSGSYGPASRISAMPGFEAPVDWSADFGSRMSGYYIPPTTGDYVFFICSDDDSDLWLGTNSSRYSVRLIAQQEGWAPSRSWVTNGDAANFSEQRRSDRFTPDQGATTPYQLGIPLVGGQKYFIMATHREGGGGDNLGVYAKLVADPDPEYGDPSNLTNGVVSMLTWPATTLSITTQPVDTQAFEAQNAVLTVAVTTDSELTPVYQWQRNQVNMAGRTSPTLDLSPANLADNGAKYRSIITLPSASLSVTSAEVTLTVQASVFIPSLVKQELWGPGAGDRNRADIESGAAGPPTTSKFIAMFDQPDFADNYGQRLSTWFKPPQNGNYVFFLCSDDDSDLFLSTNDDPATKRLIAQQAGWSGTRDWDGGQNVPQRRSDQWSPNNDGSMPYAAGIPLLANQIYYLEAVHHEGGGGDNLSAYYVIYDGVNPAVPPGDGTPSNLSGDRAGVKLPAPTTLEITSEPADQNVPLWATATFNVTASTDALYPPSYQWRRGGVNIAGATTSQYSLATKLGDSGATFDVVVTLAASSLSRTSRLATLTIPADTVPPTVLGAGAIAKSDGTTIELGLEFNEPLSHASATTVANYTLSKGTVTGVRHYNFVAMPTFDAVALEVTGLVNGDTVNLTVQNVQDFSGTPVATTVKSVAVNTAIRYAIVGGRELFNTPPAGTTAADWPDEAIALGNGHYLTLSGCNGHWDQYDEQTYVYEVLTGDFQRVVRIQSQDDSSNWGRVGVMAREELQEGMDRATMAGLASRNLNIRANPVRQWNGSVANNQIENLRREFTAGGYVGSGGAGGTPAYPNQWFRITRSNNVAQCSHSADGVNWTTGGSMDADPVWPSQLYVGPFYAPELNNNGSVAGIGHSTKAIFQSFAAQVVLPAVGPTLTITKSGSNVQVSWSPAGGQLQSRTSLTSGTWLPAGSANPTVLPISGGEMYFRVVTP